MSVSIAQASLDEKLKQLDGFVIESLRDVCSTMLGWAVTTAPEMGSWQPTAFELLELNGCIGLVGKLNGSIFLSCSEAIALRMARMILGTEVTSQGHELADVVGELSNMLAGGCKSRLCDHECPVVMSIPNIVRGKLIRAITRDVKFMLQRDFVLPIPGERLKVTTLGKFE